MPRDCRVTDSNGSPLNFTCENGRFKTNLEKGVSHGPSQAMGSVFPTPLVLVSHSSYTLWLEHVVEKETGDECYWLMWYDASGKPTIPMSGIFHKDQLADMTRQLASFVP
jgi:hypothetical protein